MGEIELIDSDESFHVGTESIDFVIRRIPQDVYLEIRRRHTTIVEEPGGTRREVTNETEVDKDSLDYIVQGWPKGVKGKGAVPPCTRANKWSLPRPARAQLLHLGFGAINTRGDVELELKNLPPSCPPADGQAGSTSGV